MSGTRTDDDIEALIRNGGFEEIDALRIELSYEARAIATCDDCEAAWIGTKAGELCRLDLGESPSSRKVYDVNSTIRALVHFHLASGQPITVAGTDAGFILTFRGNEDAIWEPEQEIPLEDLLGHEDSTPAPERSTADRHYRGVTALAYMPNCGSLAVAHRRPGLAVIEDASLLVTGNYGRCKELPVPGWVQWLVLHDGELVAVTRNGDLRRWGRMDGGLVALAHDATSVPPVPRAVVAGGKSLLIGAKNQLWESEPTVSQSTLGVLDRITALAGVPTSVGGLWHEVIVGRQDRTIHRFDCSGAPQIVPRVRTVSAEVLRLGVVGAASPGPVSVIAALKDHTIRAYRLRDLPGACTALLVEGRLPHPERYPLCTTELLLTDRVTNPANQWEVLLAQADNELIPRLSRCLRIVKTDLRSLVRRSFQLLCRYSPRRGQMWTAFIAQHLDDIQVACRQTGRQGQPLRNFVAWTRFVRKYMLLGDTFLSKHTKLEGLVNDNVRISKYLGALIYATRRYHQRYDLTHEIYGPAPVVDWARLAGRPNAALIAFADGTVVRPCATRGEAGRHQFRPPKANARLTSMSIVEDPARKHTRKRNLKGYPVNDRVVVAINWRLSKGHDLLELHSVRMTPDTIQVAGGPTRKRFKDGVSKIIRDPRKSSGRFFIGTGSAQRPLFGVVWSGRAWKKQPLAEIEDTEGVRTRIIARAPGHAPASAMAAAPWNDNTFVAIGNELGDLHLALVNGGSAIVQKALRFPSPITALTATIARDGSEDRLFCIVGTASGSVHALAVTSSEGSLNAAHEWRDTFRTRVQSLVTWRPADSLFEEKVVVALDERGRASFYQLEHHPDLTRVRSESGNFRFRGMRLDRVTLPGRPIGICLGDDGVGFTLIGDEGASIGQFCWLRDSTRRGQLASQRLPVTKLAPPRTERQAGTGTRDRTVAPMPLSAQLYHLFAALDHEFIIDAEDDSRKRVHRRLDLLSLLPEGDGAMHRFVRRIRCWDLDPWSQSTPDRLGDIFRDQIEGLAPKVRSDREQLKVVIKSLARTLVDLPRGEGPEDLFYEAIKLLRDYYSKTLSGDDPGTRRLRVVVMKEVLCPRFLSFLKLVTSGKKAGKKGKLRRSCVQWVSAALRDGDRIVRVETLRAIAVALRNAAMDSEWAEEFMQVQDVEWLLQLIRENLARFPALTHETVTYQAWYYASVLTSVFRLLPFRCTLEVCDYIARAGISSAVLRVCQVRLKERAELVALYCVVELDGRLDRHRFVEAYDSPQLPDTIQRLLGKDWEEQPTARHLSRWFPAAVRLLRLQDTADVPATVEKCENLISQEEKGGPYTPTNAALRELLAGLKQLNRSATSGRDPLRLLERLRSESEQYPGLTVTERVVLIRIVDHMQHLYRRAELQTGDVITYTTQNRNENNRNENERHEVEIVLDKRIGSGSFGVVFRFRKKNGGLVEGEVIKVCKHPESDAKRKAFLDGAQVNADLSVSRSSGVVPVLEVYRHPRFPAYRMRHCKLGPLSARDVNGGGELDRSVACERLERAVPELFVALAKAHGHGQAHGDIHTRNILMDGQGTDVQFFLADFDLAYLTSAGSTTIPAYEWLPDNLRRAGENASPRGSGELRQRLQKRDLPASVIERTLPVFRLDVIALALALAEIFEIGAVSDFKAGRSSALQELMGKIDRLSPDAPSLRHVRAALDVSNQNWADALTFVRQQEIR